MEHYDSLESFISDLPRNTAGLKDRLKGHDGLFFLDTKDGRSVAVSLREGEVSITEQTGSPDCRVTASEKDLLGVINGQLSPAKAILFGRIRVNGNPAKLLELIRLINA